jgi:hypothetical protein
MTDVCPNCKGTANLIIHWYKPNRKSDRIIYRCRELRTQSDVCEQARRRFLKLWDQTGKQLREKGKVDSELLRRYRDAKAALLVASGALDEEYSKHAI